MKSIEQSRDLVNIIKASESEWSHELKRQYRKRMSSLFLAEGRQLEKWNFGDGWQRADASRKIDEIAEARSELIDLYGELLNRLKRKLKSKQ